ncbi:hypothetical protein SSPO_001230 [Streptomyces antimycoticus]|uniref:HTH cro/C1-type domain-containing protein n=1 Tax=Streptomyces antimycoticus TaxID=68175 RepID=A0A499UA19_9ACTN|nr:helix-turn-helix transcriptional regulator [Streptomyces antimycoticus]BBJ37405.1 hypothetical protein SSPO_001230 [Streptomyces antimycoticus]
MSRPEKDIAAEASEELVALVRAMRETRRIAGVTYQELSHRTHYSVATLSTAASGKGVPRWETVKAFVTACDPHTGLDGWNALWQAAKDACTAAGVSSARGPRGGGSRKSGWMAPRARSRPAEPPPAGSESLVALVREATRTGERALAAPRVPADPMRAALGLCTTPADFTALLQHVREDANLTLREITDRSTRLTRPISKTAAADMLSGKRLPSTEQLHAFLLACEVPPERTLMWHHAVTRLKIAQIRQLDAPLKVSPRLFLADHQPWMMVGIALLTVMIQVLQVFGR